MSQVQSIFLRDSMVQWSQQHKVATGLDEANCWRILIPSLHSSVRERLSNAGSRMSLQLDLRLHGASKSELCSSVWDSRFLKVAWLV